jgi:hypothetical protein
VDNLTKTAAYSPVMIRPVLTFAPLMLENRFHAEAVSCVSAERPFASIGNRWP